VNTLSVTREYLVFSPGWPFVLAWSGCLGTLGAPILLKLKFEVLLCDFGGYSLKPFANITRKHYHTGEKCVFNSDEFQL
jgi:hypothetical protein